MYIDLGKQIMVMEIIVSVILLFVGIAVLVIIHMCIARRAFRREFGGDGVLQRGSVPIIKGTGMNPQDLPCSEYREVGEKGTGFSKDCAVCLDSFKVGDKCRILPNCNHWFHVHCVDTWLIKTPLCPLCRTTAKLSRKVQDSVTGEQNCTTSVAALAADDFL